MRQAKIQVFVGHLRQAAAVFKSTAKEFESHMPKGGFACPSGGSGDLDAMIAVAVQTIGEMHHIFYQAIEQHGRKISMAADRSDGMEESALEKINTVNGILQDMASSDYVPPVDFKSPLSD